MFEHYRGKHSYKMRKLRALGSRRIFVLSNTQNNLTAKAQVTGLDFTLSSPLVSRVKSSLARLFPRGTNELIVVTRKDRVSDDPGGWPCFTYLIDPTTLGPDDVQGDYNQWADMFRLYFSAGACDSRTVKDWGIWSPQPNAPDMI
jgi:hypothetical protein